VTAMPRPRCGNDPRAQLTDGDRQAIADFRAYLAKRHQEKTMTDLEEARANLEAWLETGDARAALERFEAAVRADERAFATRAAVLREAANVVGNDDTCDCGGCDSCVPNKLAAELRRMADEAEGR
jgi:hypothetical protein